VHDPVERWYRHLALTEHVEVWLLTWTPGQATRPHDHGGASGSYTVLDGVLTETWRDGPGPTHRAVRPHGTGSAFGPDRVHVVANQGSRNATSVHAYSPPLLPLGEALLLDEPA
jgi:predicted metal-dependent enzyme (double-stranded beta helix superfamily)